MEIKVNDYVRTKWGEIAKIKKFAGTNSCGNLYQLDIKGENDLYCEGNIIKSSPRIIDLIEVGDYINGKKVIDTYTDYIFDYSEEFKVIRFSETDILHNTKHIKSVLTKEVFEKMEYKIEKE